MTLFRVVRGERCCTHCGDWAGDLDERLQDTHGVWHWPSCPVLHGYAPPPEEEPVAVAREDARDLLDAYVLLSTTIAMLTDALQGTAWAGPKLPTQADQHRFLLSRLCEVLEILDELGAHAPCARLE